MERGVYSQRLGPRCPPRAPRSLLGFSESARERAWSTARILVVAFFQCQGAGNRWKKTRAPDACMPEPSGPFDVPTLDDRAAICASPAIGADARKSSERERWSRRNGSIVQGGLEFQIELGQLKRVMLRRALPLFYSPSMRV